MVFDVFWTKVDRVASIRLEVNNRADVRWRLESAEVLRPRGAKAAAENQVPRHNDPAGGRGA